MDLDFAKSTGEDAHHLSEDGFSEAKRYLVQSWGGGTICDMTGMPRRVEVQVGHFISLSQFVTNPDMGSQFHCNTQSTDRIALIRETAICEYLMVIHTPRLCSEPLFLASGDSSSSEVVQEITCDPVASSNYIAPEIAPPPSSPSAESSAATESTPQKDEELQTIFQDDPEEAEIIYVDETGTRMSTEEAEYILKQQELSQSPSPKTIEENEGVAAVIDITDFTNGDDLYKAVQAEVAKVYAKFRAGQTNDPALRNMLNRLAGTKAKEEEKVVQKPEADRPYIGSSTQQTLRAIYDESFAGAQKDEQEDERKRGEL